MPLDFSSLSMAINSLKSAIKVSTSNEPRDIITTNTIKSGVIQNFEFTFELCWKFIKRWLENNYGNSYADGVTRKELFRMAAENKLIDNAGKWMQYYDARNETSHAYNAATANEVYQSTLLFLDDAVMLLKVLEKRND